MTSIPLFWLAAFALVAVTLAALLWPLVRRRAEAQDDAPEEVAAATTIYRDQKRQLDADRAAGAITDVEHQAALDELASRLGAEISTRHSERGAAPATPERVNTRAPWIAALVLVATVPAAAVFAYFVLGNPAAMSPQTLAGSGGVSDEQMRAMVDNLAQKMKANPADPKGWVLLARSYTALGRFPEAVDAYAQAAQRMPPDAQLLADWADAAAMAQGRKLAGKPAELIARALAVDPTNMKALALSATSKLEGGDVAGSIAQWRELRAMLPNGGDDAREIDTVIAQLEAQRSKAGAGAATPGAAAPAPSATVAPAAATPAPPVVAAATALTGSVELDPKVASRVAPDDTVFVLARAAEGPRMPLAVQRFRAAELPRAFRLDDSMSMAPGMTISTVPRVVVEARVSKSGNATTQPGDVRGVSAPVAPGAAGLRIVIGDVVP